MQPCQGVQLECCILMLLLCSRVPWHQPSKTNHLCNSFLKLLLVDSHSFGSEFCSPPPLSQSCFSIFYSLKGRSSCGGLCRSLLLLSPCNLHWRALRLCLHSPMDPTDCVLFLRSPVLLLYSQDTTAPSFNQPRRL